jgi:polyisoprenoid-binding protein YceI
MLLSFLLAVAARGTDFAIDPVHSSLAFKVKHLGVSYVAGHFDKFSGTVSFDPKELKTLQASATIETSSVNTGNERRDNHLRSADFFDVAKFPQLTFTSQEVKDVVGEKFKLVGDLTLHGVTKRVTLDCEFGGAADSPFGDVRAGFSATTTINREDFGITGGQAGALVGKDVKITLEVEAAAKK